MDRIYINIIFLENDFLDNYNSPVIINQYENLVINYKTFIKYYVEFNINIKKYFIDVPYYIDLISLTKNNFKLELSDDLTFDYGIYKDDCMNSLIIYKKKINIPVYFLGLPNISYPINININYSITQSLSLCNFINDIFINDDFDNNNDIINNDDNIKTYSLTLFNNTNNYIILDGKITKITINIIYNNDIIYKTYDNKVDINNYTKIYIYDDNYYKIDNITNYIIDDNKYNMNDNIIFYINYFDNNNIIISLQTQTLELLKYYDENDNMDTINYNTIFFDNNYYQKNNRNNDNILSLMVFQDDYNKYLLNSDKNIIIKDNLYDIIIKNDNDLKEPIIIDLNYKLDDLNKLQINNLFKLSIIDNNLITILKSDNLNITNLSDYLINYNIISYNLFKIINLNNYVNNTFKNNISNGIKCYLIFKINNIINYKISVKMFMNKNNFKVYHKKYDILNNSDDLNKKLLIKQFIFLLEYTTDIELIFYRNEFTYNTFNRVIVDKYNFDIFFNISPTSKDYTNYNLLLNIELKKNYYILFFNSKKNTFLDNYDEIIFKVKNYCFNMIKIDEPNYLLDKNIFYIVFNNIKELNVFMNYIEKGIFNNNIQYENNYFNINKSLVFYNYYNINNYWINCHENCELQLILNKKNDYFDKNHNNYFKIYFSIKNLKVNNIFLYGNNDIIVC